VGIDGMNGYNWLDMSSTPSSSADLAGVFPVISTPFHDDGRCDEAGLRRLIGYIAEAGAHGGVYPAIASEFATLSLDERQRMVDVALEAMTARALPLVVGVSSPALETSQALARQARSGGAGAIMLMPPRELGNDTSACVAFIEAVGEAADGIPVVLQNAPPPAGSAMTVETVLEIVSRVPQIRYVKEENTPCGQRISRILAGQQTLAGVMGGAGGRFVLDESARGACGSMPACDLVEVQVAIWDAVQAGNIKEARMLHTRVLPLLDLASVFRQHAVKRVLKHRGLIASDRLRDTGTAVDDYDRAEIDACLATIGDLATTVGPEQHAGRPA
jgi:4-hydroxy-tetrahydrodipicolinate synthase